MTRIRRLRSASLILAGLVPPVGIIVAVSSSFLPTENYLTILLGVSLLTILVSSLLLLAAVWADREMNKRYRLAANQVARYTAAYGVDFVGEMPGWKVAEISGTFPRLTGLTGAAYEPVDSMECLVDNGHESPRVGCTCGFHAFWNVDQAYRAWRAHRGTLLLLVEGYGTVVEHEDGWRAQRQEVLQVVLPPRCSWCRRPAAGIASPPNSESWSVSCTRCGGKWHRSFMDLPALRAAWRTEVAVHEGPRLPRSKQWWRTWGGPGL